jgi:hypothetical protein
MLLSGIDCAEDALFARRECSFERVPHLNLILSS